MFMDNMLIINLQSFYFIISYYLSNFGMEQRWGQIIKQKYDQNNKQLQLVRKEIMDSDIKIILTSVGIFGHLKSLSLKFNKIGNNGVKSLATINFNILEILDLNHNQIGAEAIKHLAAGKLNNLRILDLSYNVIGDQGIKYLTIGNFQNLKVLHMMENIVGPEGVKYLVNGNLKNLTLLNLYLNYIREPNTTYFRLLLCQKRLATFFF